MKKFTFFLLLCLVATACSDSSVQPDKNDPNLRALSAAENQVVKGSNDFAFTLFSNTLNGKTSNAFLSPLSVSMALAMTLNGASEETALGILETIDYGDVTKDSVNQGYKDLTNLLLSMDKKATMGVANSVWYSDKYQANTTFSKVIEDYYDGTVQAVDFGDPNSKDAINDWVEDKTNGRISDLLSSIDPEEVMFLVNTIYFKADWTYKFDKSRTRKAAFTTIGGGTRQTDMMSAEAVSLRRLITNDLTLLDIPYGNGQFRFTVLMPHDPAQLSAVVENLSASSLGGMLDASDSMSMALDMPKFAMTWKDDIKNTLVEMGMPTQGFPRLLTEQQQELEISRIIHQTFLEVNEDGSEAAAATAVGISVTSAGPSFAVNKPFVFMIRENHSGTILFVGQLTDPGSL